MKEYIILLAFCCLQFIQVGCNKNVVLMIADDFRCLINWQLTCTSWSILHSVYSIWPYESLKRAETDLREIHIIWRVEYWSTGQTNIVITWAPDGKKSLGQTLEFMKEVTSSAHLGWKLPTLIILHQKVSFLQMPTPR